MALGRVHSDDDVDVASEMQPREGAVRELVALARDERGGMAPRLEQRERFADALELAQHLVVMRALELAVGEDHPLRLLLGRNEVAHLRDERRADAGDPLLVGRRGPAVRVEGVVKGGEEERDRIGERAVEIEEEGERIGESMSEE